MSSPRLMPTRPARGLVDLASSVNSSFMPASPIAQEIVAMDLSEMPCEEAAHDAPDDCSESGEEPGHGPTLYRQPHGIASGYSRPAVLPEPVGAPVLTKGEKLESQKQGRNLLRDNHLLPPKHGSSSGAGVVTRAYRRLFGAQDGEPAGGGSHPTETSPLLPGQPRDASVHDAAQMDEQWNAAVASGSLQTTWQREAKTIAGYSQSLIVTFVLQYSINMASIFYIGHIGTMELGAISLATMTANITCYAPLQGLATSLDTLCSQAYGSGHKHLVGLQFQRMAWFLLCLSIPIAALWVFAGDLLAMMIPDAGAAQLAGLYLRVTIAGIPAYALFECGKRFVQAQGLFAATTYVLLIVAPLNLVLLWLFIYQFEWGFIGAPLAVTITQNLMPLLLYLYVVLVDGSQCWGGFSSRAWSNWGPMIRLSVPGMIMVVAEWLAFEILTLAASRLGTEYLAAQSILTTLTSMTFQIPFPLSIAVSTRIANLIGANLVQNAKTSAKVAFVGGVLVAVFNMVLLSSLRHQLPLAFTSDQEVVALVAEIMPLVAVMQVFDGLAAMAHGLLRGIGRQHFGGYVNLLSYYLVALPVSFGFAFGLGWKLTGLWFGVTIGLFLVATCEYLYVYLVDWDHSAREAEHRNATA